MSIYIYVDGESHYVRSTKFWQSLHGDVHTLATVTSIANYAGAENLFTKAANWFTHDETGKLFWDAKILRYIGRLPDPFAEWVIRRAIYVTSFAGGPDRLHDFRNLVRSAGLDPLVFPETSSLAARRSNELNQHSVIEKPKGVDVALTVQLLEDAFHSNFEHCYLFTSDVDYLPAIEAVRRRGKRVYVAGFKDGLSKQSPLEYVPDAFIDLGQIMREKYCLKASPG